MNCHDIAAILDEHRTARLTAAERSRVDAHVATCGDCAVAWQATEGLLALEVPAAPASLRTWVLGALGGESRTRRRASAPIVVGVLLAGAALAGIAVVSLTDRPPKGAAAIPTSAATAPATPTTPTSLSAPVLPAPSGVTQPSDRSTDIELVNTSAQPVPFLRVLPAYPPAALAAGLEGRVVIESTVTAAGLVEGARVIESTDAHFEAAALDAFVQWRYLPRIVAGRRTATENVRTNINFSRGPTPTRTAIQRTRRESALPWEPTGPGRPLDPLAFPATMETAWQRVIADDLRGAELALDEFRATYALPPFTEGEIWNAYGYVYTLQGSYDRAIEAYETAVTVFDRAGSPTQGRWVELANLYFARNQYDMALKTLLRPPRGTGADRRPYSPEAAALLEKLRALGITEDTVSAP